mgnify:CR=1 FL=1
MSEHKLIILQEVFPLHYEKIEKLMDSNPDLQTIIDDVLECHQVLSNKSAPYTDAPVPLSYWEELYDELKKEAIDLISREMT